MSGFLYHLIIVRDLCPLNRIHLDTRIIGAQNNNDRFDLVIGDVQQREDGRPAVLPEAIIEIKMFPQGFTNQEHHVHFENILNVDLKKLGPLQNIMRVEFIYDEVNYLGGQYNEENRRDVIVETRDHGAQGVYLVFARRVNGNWRVSVSRG
ncbi:MAG: hypothetical protein ACP5L3_07190 [Caldisericum sp.]|uniref:hypothetical protein n=1 Tax=Caldisericum sp. TaxID=2499687 RepID=UPI003D0E6034